MQNCNTSCLVWISNVFFKQKSVKKTETLNAIKFHSTKGVPAYISVDRLVGQNENTTSHQLNMN
jgi:hypothetical protein